MTQERDPASYGSPFSSQQDGVNRGRRARSGLRPRQLIAVGVAVAVAATLAVGFAVGYRPGGGTVKLPGSADAAAVAPAVSAPNSPPAQNCGNHSVIWNPHKTRPSYTILVPSGDNSNFNFNRKATFWFATGTHTLGTGEFAQIDPVSGSTFIGAAGAVLNGRYRNHYAFGGQGTHITIEYLTIEYFGVHGIGDNNNEGVVNKDYSSYWNITHSTINSNGGAGAMLGSYNTLSYDCLENNGQYGFNAYAGEPGPTDITITHTEIYHNDTYNWEARQSGCGCTGGGKFWYTNGATLTDNYIYDNYSVGIWADTNNTGFEFVGNYFANNQSVGLEYEISYNALIEWNTFVGNGITGALQNPGFPTSAIYISESGSDSRVHSAYSSRLLIAANKFINNWGGVILWENSNRYCASPDNSSSGDCTLVNPTAANLTSCADATAIAAEPLFSDCRWKTQNVMVTHNIFTFDPKAVGTACQSHPETCGYNGVFSEYGTDPSWSPYMKDIVPGNIAFSQNNHFQANQYHGPWQFMGWELGSKFTWSKWSSCAAWNAVASLTASSCGQDQDSTMAAS